MGNTQAAMQRRLGRLSMLIDIVATKIPGDEELVTQLKKELGLIKEISMRLVEMPFQPHRDGASSHAANGPPVTSRRP